MAGPVISITVDDMEPFVRFARIVPIDPHRLYPPKCSYSYRLFFVHRGKGLIAVEAEEYRVEKGDLFVIGPGAAYSFSTQTDDPLVLINLYFDFTSRFRCDTLLYTVPSPRPCFEWDQVNERITFTDLPIFNRPLYLRRLYSLEETLLEIVAEEKIRKKYYIKRMSSLLTSVLLQVARHASAPEAGTDSGKNPVDQVIEYLHRNYGSDLSNREIAAVLKFHPNYINRLMVENTGASIHQYLINVRLSKAMELIHTTNKSLSEIADMVGFKTLNHFSKLFKKKVGRPPSELR